MGIYDRGYYRDDDSPPSWGSGGARQMGAAAWSIITWLIVINAAIFIIDGFSPRLPVPPGYPLGANGRWLSSAMALNSDLFTHPWNAWQLLTYGFAHSSLGTELGIWHVLFNMFGLWMFGREIEERLGRREFLTFYLCAIVFAGLVWVIAATTYSRPAAMVGASGAVSAVVILFAAYFPQRKVFIFGVFPLPAFVMAIAFVGMDLLGSLSGKGGTAFEAHLAGAAFAVVYWKFGWNLSRFLPALGRFRLPSLKSRTSLKIHDPEDAYQEQDSAADKLLDKVRVSGEASLTRKERALLEAYSRRMRQKHR